MSVLEQLKRYREATDRALQTYFKGNSIAPKLLGSMEYSLLGGGKRIRPALALAACEASGGTVEDALPVACALEMIHTYSLIHDDLPSMDNDDLRRGRSTNHKVYGEAMAILAGDGLITEAFQCLSCPEWKVPQDRRLDIIGIISNGAGYNGMVGGQALDLEFEGKDFDEKTLEKIHAHKTGKLLLASVLAGGRAGGAYGETLECLRRYGQSIGLAFQIADDVLDVTKTTEELGKDSKSDLKKKKATYPLLLGLKESKKRAQSLLEEALLAVKPLEEKGHILADLARYIVDRPA